MSPTSSGWRWGAASVFGEHFHHAGVAVLTTVDAADRQLREQLAQLAAEELIARSPSAAEGSEGYRFRSTLVREAVYAMPTEEDRVLGHRLAGGWLEQMEHVESLVLAEHYTRGHAPARAARCLAIGAREKLDGGDFAGSIEAAHRGLELLAGGGDVTELHLIAGEAASFSGDIEGCATEMGAAVSSAEVGGDPWFRGMGYRIWALQIVGRSDELAEALALLRDTEPLGDVGPLTPVIAYC